MKIGTPPFQVTVTDANGIITTFETSDLELDVEIEEPPRYPHPYAVIVVHPTPRVKYYKMRATTESIVMDATNVRMPTRHD